jgi:GxxExxY protein
MSTDQKRSHGSHGLHGSRLGQGHATADGLKYADVTDAIIHCFYDVYNELGDGFLESVYREAMIVALREADHCVQKEQTVEVIFRGVRIGLFRTDLVVDNKVIVELKSTRCVEPVHEAQLLNYLKARTFEVGLLLNFGPRPHFRRMLLDNNFKDRSMREVEELGLHPDQA